MADLLCLDDLQDMGFNVFNTANNHSMDYSHGGLLATLHHLDERGIPHCGTGSNLARAAQPVIVDCRDGRVALMGITSSFHDSHAAGPQNEDYRGRPGVNPLRHRAVYELDEASFAQLTRIARLTGINSYHDQARKEGYMPREDVFKFGTFNFRCGEECRAHTTPAEQDLKRTVDAIRDARYRADAVVVSIHSHQFKNGDKHCPPDFVRTFARECIDAGADIVVCHGPHVMRGVEVYNGGIVLHGLGNFILQHESMVLVPEEQYIKAGTTRADTTGVGEVINLRNQGGKIGLASDPDAWVSFFASVEWSPSGMKVKLIPIEIDSRKNNGLPRMAIEADSILEAVERLSAEWNTAFTREGNALVVEVSR